MPINQTSVWNGSQWVTMGGVVDTASNYNWAGSHNFAQSAIFQDDVRVKSLNGGQLAGFRNKIINGGFDVWQRGTSFTNPTTDTFFADRWRWYFDGSSATTTISQQSFTPGNQITGHEPQYFLRFNQSVAGTGGANTQLRQRIEDVRTLAGQQVTVSFWAKVDSARSIAVSVDQWFGSGGSATVYNAISNLSISLTTSWARYSYTATMPSISGKTIGSGSFLQLLFAPPANTVQTLDLWGVQFEAGTIATPFEYRPIGTELALCQRYYYRHVTGNQSSIGVGYTEATNIANTIITYPVTMRSTPTLDASSGTNYYTIRANGTAYFFNTLAFSGRQSASVADIYGAPTLASGIPGGIYTGNASSYVGFSAEL